VADEDTTKAHLTAVGMSGSDAQIARLLAALGTSSHDDVATFVTAALTRFSRNAQFSGLTQANEQKLWTYRNLWAKVRGGADGDAALLTEGWKHSTAAFTAIS
jgi:hypothetical protein